MKLPTPTQFDRFKADFRIDENCFSSEKLFTLKFEWQEKRYKFTREYRYVDQHTIWEFFELAHDHIMELTGEKKPVQLEFDWSKSYDS